MRLKLTSFKKTNLIKLIISFGYIDSFFWKSAIFVLKYIYDVNNFSTSYSYKPNFETVYRRMHTVLGDRSCNFFLLLFPIPPLLRVVSPEMELFLTNHSLYGLYNIMTLFINLHKKFSARHFTAFLSSILLCIYKILFLIILKTKMLKTYIQPDF